MSAASFTSPLSFIDSSLVRPSRSIKSIFHKEKKRPAGSGGPGSQSGECKLVLVVPVSRPGFPENLPSDVLTVLLGEKDPPASAEGRRDFGSKQPCDARVTVRLVPAGNFVVAVVLEARLPAELRIERRRFVASLCEDANRLVRRVAIVGVEVEKIGGVQRIALSVQRVARIFNEHDAVLVPEAAVVQSGVRHVAAVDQRESAGVASETQTEDGAKSAKCSCFGQGVGVAGGVEDEFREVCARRELGVFRSLEGSTAGGFGQGIGAVRIGAVQGGVVDCDPSCLEDVAIGVQVFLVLGRDVGVGAARMEHDGAGVGLRLHLEDLQFAAGLQVGGVGRKETVDKAVRLAGVRESGSIGATRVLNQNQAAPLVGLDALIGSPSDDAGDVFNLGRNVQSCLQDAGVRTALGGESKVTS